jgi:hypothetical protein
MPNRVIPSGIPCEKYNTTKVKYLLRGLSERDVSFFATMEVFI